MRVERARFLNRRIIANPKVIACLIALADFASAAKADGIDPGGVKDMQPHAAAGVTVYGAIDVGYAYQTHGAPLSGADYEGLNYTMFGAKQNRQQISTLSNNGLSQSFIGAKAEDALYENWKAVAKAETGFVPL